MPLSIHLAVELHLDPSPLVMPLLMTRLVCIHSQVYHCNIFISDSLLVAPEDYNSSTGILTFNTGDARQCHDVPIVNDRICEELPEQFLSNLALASGAPVTVDPATARVIIFDDTGDCVRK